MSLSKLLDMVKFTASEIVVAYIVSFIAPGGPLVLAKLILAIKLNIFALPLAPTPALALPPWCWYIVSILWIRQWLYYSEYTVADVFTQLEADVERLTSSDARSSKTSADPAPDASDPDDQPAMADGGAP